tara:strand:+ start:2424 stop:2912 length:489 start_codon:yes stop_codon:yes gene_type:complete
MSSKKDSQNIKNLDDDRDEDGGSGQVGSIEFRDFVTGISSLREDNLPPDELKRIRAVHNTAHESRVKKQKELRQNRQDLKDGKITMDAHREKMSAEMQSDYPPHPTLSDKAQFSGIDKQENQVPSLNEAQTNDENRNELQNEYQKKFQPEMGKKFNPKPQFG